MTPSVLFSPTLSQTLLLIVVGFVLSIIIYKIVLKNEGVGTLSFKDVFIILLPGYALNLVEALAIKETNSIIAGFISLAFLAIFFFVFHWMLKRYVPSVSIQKSFKVFAIAFVIESIILFIVGGLLIAGNWDQLKEIAQNRPANSQSQIDPEWMMRNRWWIVFLSIAAIIGLFVFNRKVSSKMPGTESKAWKITKWLILSFFIAVFVLILGLVGFVGVMNKKFVEQQQANYTIPSSAISDIPGGTDLANYITTQLKRGVSKEDIRKTLIDTGWQAQYVDRALNAVIEQR